MRDKHLTPYPHTFAHPDIEAENVERDAIFDASMRASYFRALDKIQRLFFEPDTSKHKRNTGMGH
jgi:hypothetical protein